MEVKTEVDLPINGGVDDMDKHRANSASHLKGLILKVVIGTIDGKCS